jgi:peroxiredoxin
MALQTGQKAPDFKLPDPDKKMVSLSDFKGKNVVLFFFPMAWTGACTKEMCTIQEDFAAYAKLNAVPVGISVDSIFALKRFKEDYKLNDIILLSDFNKEAIKAYDVVFDNFSVGYNGVARRSTFVIDKDGIVRFAEVLPQQGDQPDMEAIRKALAELI